MRGGGVLQLVDGDFRQPLLVGLLRHRFRVSGLHARGDIGARERSGQWAPGRDMGLQLERLARLRQRLVEGAALFGEKRMNVCGRSQTDRRETDRQPTHLPDWLVNKETMYDGYRHLGLKSECRSYYARAKQRL
ncbi:hypothetical protein MRB53_039466 [Persea americana]|nr:hypothetical protein MRB53_039466 [Persea americana]